MVMANSESPCRWQVQDLKNEESLDLPRVFEERRKRKGEGGGSLPGNRWLDDWSGLWWISPHCTQLLLPQTRPWVTGDTRGSALLVWIYLPSLTTLPPPTNTPARPQPALQLVQTYRPILLFLPTQATHPRDTVVDLPALASELA